MPLNPGDDIQQGSLRITIKVDGNAMNDSIGINSIIVRHSVNQISYAEIGLVGDDPNKSTLPIIDGKTFDPGKSISISIAYDSNQEVNIFSGSIVEFGLEMNDSNLLRYNLLAKHDIVKTTYFRKEQEFEDKTDAEIITDILSEYDISNEVDDTDETYELMIQKMATCWDFLRSRAEYNGFLVTMDGTKVIIGSPVFDSDPVLRVAYGSSIISFKGDVSIEKQPASIEASAWDVDSKALVKSNSSEPNFNSKTSTSQKGLAEKWFSDTLLLTSNTAMTTSDLKTWADNTLLKYRFTLIRGEVTFIGNSSVKTGDIITLEGVGEKFNGNIFVTGVTHKIKVDGNWETTVQFGLDERFVYDKINFNYPDATGQLPGIKGLQIGVVQKLAGDPQSLNRIQVMIQTNATTQVGCWARFSNFYATSGAGLGFLPEIGDEVVLGFLENDPRHPIILGSLYGGKNLPGYPESSDENFIKQILTKGKIEIKLDDENKVITITTPGENKIIFDDKDKSIKLTDEHDNSIHMESKGITITSAKNITLSAKGDITLDAAGKLSLSAKKDNTLEGMNVTIKANSALKASGNSEAQFSSSGKTDIKGTLVNIN